MSDQWNEMDEYQEQANTDSKMTTMRRRIKDLEIANVYLSKQLDVILAENFNLRKLLEPRTVNPDVIPQDRLQSHLHNLKTETEKLQANLEKLRGLIKPS